MRGTHSLSACEKSATRSAQVSKNPDQTEARPSAEGGGSRADGDSGGGRARMEAAEPACDGGGGGGAAKAADGLESVTARGRRAGMKVVIRIVKINLIF
jgi:hypothetical protein